MKISQLIIENLLDMAECTRQIARRTAEVNLMVVLIVVVAADTNLGHARHI